MSTHGVHAGGLEDMWQVAIEIARRVGGDRGCPGLFGPPVPPAPLKPERLIVLETQGWADLDGASRAAFETVLERLQAAGVTLLGRRDHPWIEAVERAIAGARELCNAITGWENRWGTRNLVDQFPNGVSARAKATLARAEAMTPDDYRAALMDRAVAQERYAALAPLADAAIALACPGPAPLWSGDMPGEPLAPRPTGDFVFNAPSSMLFAPAVTLPLMAVDGMPVGVQLMGQPHGDGRVTAMARWTLEAIAPVVAEGRDRHGSRSTTANRAR
jgi:Asp-tRNA(Asn)/Glu-tRNA(Gln) amidotransferase A subunit family amidase